MGRVLAQFPAIIILAAILLLGCDSSEIQAPEAGDLQQFGEMHYSPLDQINVDNIDELGLAWEYVVPRRSRVVHGMEATPVVADGVLYSSGPWGAVYAVDARTGAQRWHYMPKQDGQYGRNACCDNVNRGLEFWRGKIYVGTLDGHLVALDADTGKELWRRDTFINREASYSITGAPQVAGKLVVIGNSGAEFGVRGYVTAYDLETGELAWRFFTVPGDPKKGFEHPEMEQASATWDPDSRWEFGGGGTVWGEMAYDPELNLLYVGTGNAAPYPQWIRSPQGGDNLYLSSILAINPDTGRLQWHYQTTPGDSWDYTATANMILTDLEINGQTRQVLMQAPKNGFYYVLDRATGELLSAQNFVTTTWASHIDLETGRPVVTEQADYRDGGKVIFPNTAGGHNWQPMAYNPGAGLTYIPAIDVPSFYTDYTSPEFTQGALNTISIGFDPIELGEETASALMEGHPTPKHEEFLQAWDPVTQTEKWRVPYDKRWNGGVLTTGGNLVVQGVSTGELRFYHAETGELLKSIHTGTGIMAGAMSYELDGKQYIAVMAGFGGAFGRFLGGRGLAQDQYQNYGRILAFKLGGGATPLPPPVPERVIPEPPVMPEADSKTLAEGAALFGAHCSRCHINGPHHVYGTYPDLTVMPADTYKVFKEIVLEGLFEYGGMGSFDDLLNEQQVEAIQAYLVGEQHKRYQGE